MGLLALVGLIIILGYVLYRSQNTQEVQPLTVNIATGGAGEVRALVMKYYGIDTKHGLDISFKRDTPSSLEQKVSLHQEAPGLSDISPLTAFRSQTNGSKIDIIAPSIRIAYSIAVRNDSTITTLADLKGKRVGVLPKITAPFLSISLIFHAAGIDQDRDLKLSYGTIPDMVALLQKGDVDAATVTYPGSAALFASGEFRSIAELEDLWEKNENGLTNPFVVTVAHDDWLAAGNNRELTRRYVAANLETAQLMKDRPEVVTEAENTALQAFLADNKLTSPPAQKLLRENMWKFFYPKWGNEEVAALDRILMRAKELNLVPQGASLDIVIKPSEL